MSTICTLLRKGGNFESHLSSSACISIKEFEIFTLSNDDISKIRRDLYDDVAACLEHGADGWKGGQPPLLLLLLQTQRVQALLRRPTGRKNRRKIRLIESNAKYQKMRDIAWFYYCEHLRLPRVEAFP